MEIGIALATYNSEKYIEEQLDSLLNQTYKNWICYIHDDGSTDQTLSVLDKYKKLYSNHFVILDYPPVKSAKINFMKILTYITEPYVMFCDHDDVWMKKKIETEYGRIKQLEQINSNMGILVFSDLKVVDGTLNVIDDSYAHFTGYNPTDYMSLNIALHKNISNGCTMIFNRRLLDMVNKCHCFENIVMHDYWVYLVALAYGKVDYISEPLMLYRQHENNVCGAVSNDSFLKKRIQDAKKIQKIGIIELAYKKKAWIIELRKQAKELYYIADDSETNSIIKEYLDITKKGKISRLWYYKRKNMFIKGMKLRLLIWG